MPNGLLERNKRLLQMKMAVKKIDGHFQSI